MITPSAAGGYDGLAYHIGDLRHALYHEPAYKPPTKKYARWAELPFAKLDPPTLREKVCVALISWHMGMVGSSGLRSSVAAVEKEIIALASVDCQYLLNVDGR